MRCALRSHFLTISNGLGPQIDPVFLTKRGWNTQRSFRLFLDEKKNRAGNVKWPLPRQYQRRCLTIVRITRTSRTAVARWRSSSMSMITPPSQSPSTSPSPWPSPSAHNHNHHWQSPLTWPLLSSSAQTIQQLTRVSRCGGLTDLHCNLDRPTSTFTSQISLD